MKSIAAAMLPFLGLETTSFQNDTTTNIHYAQAIYEKLFSMTEVSRHSDPSSCWVVVDNVVYDLTDFLNEHAGGSDIILEHAGRDCTVPFQEKGHSRWAMKLLQKFRIGVLRPEERIFL